MIYQIKGTLYQVSDERTFQSGFRKREFIVRTDEQYEQFLKFELHKDNCDLLDKVTTNSEVEVKFNIRGSEWKEKYYVNLIAFKIDVIQAGSAPETTDPAPPPVKTAEPESELEYDEDDDDVPF